MRLLYINIKHTGSLDFVLPVFWKLRQAHPDWELHVLQCFASSRQVYRNARYYADTLSELGVRQHDYGSFLRFPYNCASGPWRWMLASSPWDHPDYSMEKGKNGDGGWMARVREAIHPSDQDRLVARAVELDSILPRLNPDVILMAHHSVNFPAARAFHRYFEERKIPVALLPHAPHNIGPVEAFTAFGSHAERLPTYCDYWLPFPFETPWKKTCPDCADQFPFIGYPGLDSAWLSSLHWEKQETNASRPVRAMFIIRKFLPEGFKRPENYDPFTLDYDDFFSCLQRIKQAVEGAGVPVELVVKPHPSNSFPMVERIFKRSGLSRWRIDHEPFYSLMPSCDMALSLFSTSLLLPAMAGLPTVLIHTALQDYVHRWNKTREVYSGLEFYARTPDELEPVLKRALQRVAERRAGSAVTPCRDAGHLRAFFPDGAIERGMGRIEHLHSLAETSEVAR